MNNRQTLAGVCAYSIIHWEYTRILRYSYAVLEWASLGAHVPHFQTSLVMLPSLPSIQESCDRSCRTRFTYRSTARFWPSIFDWLFTN
ncbi:hypothetical protein T12_11622 [Trichinella patagoniensis]|uniref:Uncharacterized protein n=1 Tax=Trichinella patagoniensis TaxID=990121 RepID=A0A0V0ZYL4_9BILA|nr:hypothetical protein T12_11622 [Trichinella patagoniensis]